MKFQKDHLNWIAQRASSKEIELITQLSTVIPGLYYDVIFNGLPGERFFGLLRESIQPLSLVSSSADFVSALAEAPSSRNPDEMPALLLVHQRVIETLQTANSIDLSPSEFVNTWLEVIDLFKKTAA